MSTGTQRHVELTKEERTVCSVVAKLTLPGSNPLAQRNAWMLNNEESEFIPRNFGKNLFWVVFSRDVMSVAILLHLKLFSIRM